MPSLRPWILALALLFPLHAAAQRVSPDSFLPAPDQSGFSGFPSTRPPGKNSLDGTLWLDYAMATADRPQAHHLFGGTLAAQLGIMSRGALALRLPATFLDRDPYAFRGSNHQGIERVALDGRVRLLGAAAGPNGVVKDGGALALRGMLFFPTRGDANDAGLLLSLISDIEVFGILAGAELAWLHDYLGTDRTDAFKLSLGMRLPLRLLARVWPGQVQDAALLELDVTTPARDFFDKSVTPFGGRLGYRIAAGDFYGTLTFGTTFNNVYGYPDFRMTGGFGYAPRKHDQDADGVPDSEDQCVHLPEDRDGFQDDDGCADDDNDADMIVDEDDRCPLDPAEEGRDQDEDGCTDP